jgi:hypothetical protein
MRSAPHRTRQNTVACSHLGPADRGGSVAFPEPLREKQRHGRPAQQRPVEIENDDRIVGDLPASSLDFDVLSRDRLVAVRADEQGSGWLAAGAVA